MIVVGYFNDIPNFGCDSLTDVHVLQTTASPCRAEVVQVQVVADVIINKLKHHTACFNYIA